MQLISSMFAMVLVVLFASIQAETEFKKFWICEAGDPKLLGEYLTDEDNTRDGAQVFSNQNDLSIFRNNGIWYIGEL